jgi:hypothetical protein
MSSSNKPDFTPGKPTVYTPKKKKSEQKMEPDTAEGAITTQPDRERDRSIGTRLDAPPKTDLATDPNDQDLPVDLMTGKSVADEDTEELIVDVPMEPSASDNPPGEDRRP